MTEPLRDLERAAQDGLLDPVRVLVELDRRGYLSRGSVTVARASVRLDGVHMATFDRFRAIGRGLGPTIRPEDLTAFRRGFTDSYTAGLDPILDDKITPWTAGEAACNDWLWRAPARTTRGVPVFNAVMRDLAAIDAALDAGTMMALDGGYVPFHDERGSVIGVAVLDPDRVANVVANVIVRAADEQDRIDREHPGVREILRQMQESARPMSRSLAPLSVRPVRGGSPAPSKAERAREKTRANVRRPPPRRIS